jgi:hypothetical protein
MDALYRKHLDLPTAEPAELLVYALSLDPDEPVLGAVTAVQQELKLISNLMILAPPRVERGAPGDRIRRARPGSIERGRCPSSG